MVSRGYARTIAGGLILGLVVTVPGLVPAAASPPPQELRPVPAGRLLYTEFPTTSQVPGVLYSGRADGSGVTNLGVTLRYYGSPDYSPDGNRFVYILDFALRTAAADGTGDTVFTEAASAPSHPRWAPDGRRIAAESGGEIFTSTGPGTPQEVLTRGGDADLAVAWAPGGRRIATVTNGGEVLVFRVGDPNPVQRFALPGGRQLEWSPDGRTLAVEAAGDLYLVTLSTGAIRRLTRTSDVFETSPVWSPDGSTLAYGRGPLVADEYGNQYVARPVVHLMDADGTHRRATPLNGIPSSWRAAG